MLKRMLLVGSAFVLAAGSAFAADIESTAEPAVYDWSGLYLGVSGGYGWGDTEHFNGAARTQDFDLEGVIIGGGFGYNHQIDLLVLGLEADISYSDIDAEVGPGSINGFGCNPVSCETLVNWLATARLRAGLAFDRFLPFVTGGLAIGGLEARSVENDDLDEGEQTEIGWTIGGGIEFGVSENLSIKAEYLYFEFDKFRYDDGTSDVSFDADADFSIIRGGLNWRFTP